MTKRNILLAVFGILVFLSVINFLPVVHGYDYIFIDAEDDVYRYCESTDEKVIGDYHDEIDIVKLNITGKYVSFTVVGDLGNWNTSHWTTLTFSEGFSPWGEVNYACRIPYYRLEFEMFPSLFVTLEKCYILGGNELAFEVWNGTAWENATTATPANILSEVSQHSIIAYIPDAVEEEIQSNMKCLLYTHFWQDPWDCEYVDFAPALSTAGGGKIPGYNLFLLICGMIGISILLVRKRNKLK